MRIGVAINETWAFFHEIHAELEHWHQVTQFKTRTINAPFFRERINRYVYKKDMQDFLRTNNVVFFEWASELLIHATRQPKTSAIVTRLHRYEMYQWVNEIDWDRVDKIILVSKAKQIEFISRFPTQAGKTLVVPEAISIDRFQPHVKPFGGDIGILCHLTPRKRVYETILAFYELLKIQPDFRLHIAGGEHILHQDYYRALHTLVSDLGITDQVIFYGNTAKPEEWYKNIDIFISNSYSEGLQVAPMEAMACERMVFAHRWEGADELLPVENLYYSDAELVDMILVYSRTSDEEKQKQRSLLHQRVIDNFDIERIKVQIRTIIEESVVSTS